MAQNPNAMDVPDDGYETDTTADTILVGDGDDGYTSEENDQQNDQITLTPQRTNRNINPLTPGTPPRRLLTNNTQIQGQVYKMVIQEDGTSRLVPFTYADYRSGQQAFDITGRAINRNELPYIQPRALFGEEKEGGASKSRRRSKRRRTKKSLRKRRASRNKRRKTRLKK
jgi:hypothetical protein